MIYRNLCLLALISLCVFVSCTHADEEMSSVAEKVSEGKSILDKILKGKPKEIVDKIKSIGEWAGPLVDALASVAKIVGSYLFPTESEELRFLKKAFKEVNDKLDSLEYNFRDIKNLIGWNTIKSVYGNHEIDIYHLGSVLERFVNGPVEIKEFLKDEFITAYRNQYDDAGQKIFNGLMLNGLFSTNIIQEFRTYTHDNRVQTLQMIYSAVQLLLRAMQLESSYLSLTGNQYLLGRYKTDWDIRIQALENHIKLVDDDIMKNFENNYKNRLDEWITRNQHLKGEALTKFLYGKLAEEFRWRTWYIIVNKDDGSEDDTFAVTNCQGGYNRTFYRGHHIAINHGDLEEVLDKTKANETLSKVEADITDAFNIKVGAPAKYILDNMKGECDGNNKIIAAVEANEWFAVSAPDVNVVGTLTQITKVFGSPTSPVSTKKYMKIIAGP